MRQDEQPVYRISRFTFARPEGYFNNKQPCRKFRDKFCKQLGVNPEIVHIYREQLTIEKIE
jgi:hypothetical protein